MTDKVIKLAQELGVRFPGKEELSLLDPFGMLSATSAVTGKDQFGRPIVYSGIPKTFPHRLGPIEVEDAEGIQELLTLHELGHVSSGHLEHNPNYLSAEEMIKFEQQAWEWAFDKLEDPSAEQMAFAMSAYWTYYNDYIDPQFP